MFADYTALCGTCLIDLGRICWNSFNNIHNKKYKTKFYRLDELDNLL